MQVFGRERADGLYPAVFYVVLKLLNEMIALALSTLGIAVVLYWSANLNPGADNFFYFVIQLYIFTNVAVAWTFLMSTIVDNPELVTALTASSHIFFVLLRSASRGCSEVVEEVAFFFFFLGATLTEE